MMESMQAAGAESRELEEEDIADYQQAVDDQQASSLLYNMHVFHVHAHAQGSRLARIEDYEL